MTQPERGKRCLLAVGLVTTFGNGECRPGPMLVSARCDDNGVRADLLVPRHHYREVLAATARGSIDLTVFTPTSCCWGSMDLSLPRADWTPFDDGLPQPEVTCPWIDGR